MRKVRIKTVVVGKERTSQPRMCELIEAKTQEMVDQGWTLRAHGSRGGGMYLTFAKKIKDG